MKNLPEVAADGKPIRTLIPNALHFQRGVTNIRVRDLEVEFPVSLVIYFIRFIQLTSQSFKQSQALPKNETTPMFKELGGKPFLHAMPKRINALSECLWKCA